jgi:hypothetical protein
VLSQGYALDALSRMNSDQLVEYLEIHFRLAYRSLSGVDERSELGGFPIIADFPRF